jgi:hypothetical protein
MSVPAEVVAVVSSLLGIGHKLLQAGDDKERQDEALMEAQEVIKEALDRRAFGR